MNWPPSSVLLLFVVCFPTSIAQEPVQISDELDPKSDEEVKVSAPEKTQTQTVLSNSEEKPEVKSEIPENVSLSYGGEINPVGTLQVMNKNKTQKP